MSEYRDALHAAKRRIAQLEEELAATPSPPRRRVAPIFVGFVVLATGLLMSATVVLQRPKPVHIGPREAPPPPAPVEPAPPSRVVHLDVRIGRDPLVVDTNADGTDDVIVPPQREGAVRRRARRHDVPPAVARRTVRIGMVVRRGEPRARG